MEKGPHFGNHNENSAKDKKEDTSRKLAFNGSKLKLLAIGALATLSSLAAKGQEKSESFANVNHTGMQKSIEAREAITDQLRRDWNDYIDWLRGKHLAGDSSLDHNNLGRKMIDEYRLEHSTTTVSNDMVASIQEEFFKYRQWVINKFERGEIELIGKMYDPKNKEANIAVEQAFMPHLSPKVDSYSGQYTTSHKFAIEYLKSTEKNHVAAPVGSLAFIGETPLEGDHGKVKNTVEFSKIEKDSTSNKNK